VAAPVPNSPADGAGQAAQDQERQQAQHRPLFLELEDVATLSGLANRESGLGGEKLEPQLPVLLLEPELFFQTVLLVKYQIKNFFSLEYFSYICLSFA
jgi:hypothetical protein